MSVLTIPSVGCHEDKMAAPPTGGTPLASKRPASKIEPETGRVEPMNYARIIKPILTKCYACHQGKAGAPTDTSYGAQQNYAWWFAGDANGNLEAIHGGSRSKAGMVGARGSRMGKALLNATHTQAQADGKYTESDFRTIVQWLDLGSDELGHCDNPNGQKSGSLVWPSLDLNKDDPQGLKYDCEGRPCPTGGGGAGGTRASSSSQGGAGATGSSGTPAGGSQSGSAGAGGSKGTTVNSSQSGGAGAGGSTSSAASSQSGGASAGSSNDSRSGGGSSKASGGSQSSSSNASSSKGGSQSEASSASGRSSGSSGQSKSSSASGEASSSDCSMGADTRAPAHTLVLLIIGMALLVRKRRE